MAYTKYEDGFCQKCGRFMFGTGRCNWCGITYGASSKSYDEVRKGKQK